MAFRHRAGKARRDAAREGVVDMTGTIARRAALTGAIALVLALAACQNAASDWSKPGASGADLQRDQQECQAQAASLSQPVYDQRTQLVQVDPLDVIQRESSCMLVRGWRMTPVK
jgi:hypothetical protein